MSQRKSQSRKRRQSEQIKSSKPTRWLGLLLTVVVASVGLYAAYQIVNARNSPTDSGYPLEVTLEEAVAKREAGAFILDVREESEWNEYHVPGSTLIPLSTLADRVNELPRDKEIVVVCRSGNRSATGRDILRNAGFTQVTSLSGGLSKWKAQGLPVVGG
jgi:rhodanese-related sulfurtransferase